MHVRIKLHRQIKLEKVKIMLPNPHFEHRRPWEHIRLDSFKNHTPL